MHKMLSFLKKLNNTLTYSAVLCIIGLAFIFLPTNILDLAVLAIGIIFIVLSLIAIALAGEGVGGSLLEFFARGGTLLRSLGWLAVGVILVAVRSSVTETLCDITAMALGFYAVFSIVRISRRGEEKNFSWWLRVIGFVLIALAGVALSVLPILPKITAGGVALTVGIKMLVDVIMKRNSAKKSDTAESTAPGDFYTDDFVDKSE